MPAGVADGLEYLLRAEEVASDDAGLNALQEAMASGKIAKLMQDMQDSLTPKFHGER